MWNKTVFLKNVDTLVSEKCNGVAKVFNEKIKDRDAVTKWKTTEKRPAVSTLLKIAEEFKVSLDWLLTDEGPKYRGESPEHCLPSCPVQCDEKMKGLCAEVKEVVDSGTHWGSSLEANIHSFKAGLDNDKKLKKALDYIERQQSDLKQFTGTDSGG